METVMDTVETTVEERRRGRPPSRKALLTLRLEPEIIRYYRQAGQGNPFGWLQGVNDTLKLEMERRIDEAQKREERNAKRRAARAR